jgi:hypothetical protein
MSPTAFPLLTDLLWHIALGGIGIWGGLTYVGLWVRLGQWLAKRKMWKRR